MRFARHALLAGTVLIVVLETIRRWDTWREFPLAMFDDWIRAFPEP